MSRTAILVDGGFYRKRASYLWGHKTAEERANELYAYCRAHLKDGHEERYLYRIFRLRLRTDRASAAYITP